MPSLLQCLDIHIMLIVCIFVMIVAIWLLRVLSRHNSVRLTLLNGKVDIHKQIPVKLYFKIVVH